MSIKVVTHYDPSQDADVVKITIPRSAKEEAGPPPKYGEVSNVGIAADHDLVAGWESSVELQPEGVAMHLLRLAWYCGVMEVGMGAWLIPERK